MTTSSAERQAALPLPPTQGTIPGLGVTRLATSVVAAEHALDAFPHLFHKRLTIANEGADAVWLAFAPDALVTMSKAAVAGGTIAAGTLATNGFKLAGGASREVVLNTSDHAVLWLQADANTPTVAIYPSSHPL